MHRANHVLSGVLVALGATSIASACWINSSTNCCALAGVVLNLTRTCGFFHDQNCPDKAIENTGNVGQALAALVGSSGTTPGTSLACRYQIGRCTGSFGSNLCVYDAEQSTTCTPTYATGTSCTQPR